MSFTSSSVKRWFFCVFFCLFIGGVGSIAHHATVDSWYAGLIKPVGTPPNWVFPLVWTTLYVMMGTAWWSFWEAPGGDKAFGWAAFFTQLFLNFLWPWIFFYHESIGWGLFDIILLWLSIVVTIFSFYHHSKIAALLLVPYLAWVTYAAYLNNGIWFMNF